MILRLDRGRQLLTRCSQAASSLTRRTLSRVPVAHRDPAWGMPPALTLRSAWNGHRAAGTERDLDWIKSVGLPRRTIELRCARDDLSRVATMPPLRRTP